MTEPLTDLVEELAREVHGALSRADVMRYLDMPSDTAAQVARTILPILARRDAETWNRAVEAAVGVAESQSDYTTVTPFVHRERMIDAIASLKDQNNA